MKNNETKPNVEQVMEDIRKLVEEVRDQLAEINHGGCGCFAYELGSKLQLAGVPFTIEVLRNPRDPFEPEDTIEDKEKVCEEVRNGNMENAYRLGASHFMVKVEKYFIDGTDIMTSPPDGLLDIGSYTLEELKLAIDKSGNWNEDYNRTKCNPILHKIIDKHTKDWSLTLVNSLDLL